MLSDNHDPANDLADFLDENPDLDPAELNDSNAQIGARIAEARSGQGFDQEELAANLGVTVETVREWESGVLVPRGNRLTMMAGMLGVSLSWLMIGHGVEPAGGEITQLRGSVAALRRQLADVLVEIDQIADRLAALEP